MQNILIINAHEYYQFSEGKLNNALIEKAVSKLTDKEGYQVRTTTMNDTYKVDTKVEKHQWADDAHLDPLFEPITVETTYGDRTQLPDSVRLQCARTDTERKTDCSGLLSLSGVS